MSVAVVITPPAASRGSTVLTHGHHHHHHHHHRRRRHLFEEHGFNKNNNKGLFPLQLRVALRGERGERYRDADCVSISLATQRNAQP